MENRLITRFAPVGFGVIGFTVAVSLGTMLTLGTGMPLLGGLTNGVLVSMVLTIGLLAIDTFGTATIMWVVFAVCASLTTTLGPPGFYKIVIGGVAGFIWDMVYFGLGRRTVGLFVGALAGAGAIMALLLLALYLGFGKNAADAFQKYSSAIVALITMNLIVTSVGVFLGRQAYFTRLSKLQVFMDLRKHPHDGEANINTHGD